MKVFYMRVNNVMVICVCGCDVNVFGILGNDGKVI